MQSIVNLPRGHVVGFSADHQACIAEVPGEEPRFEGYGLSPAVAGELTWVWRGLAHLAKIPPDAFLLLRLSAAAVQSPGLPGIVEQAAPGRLAIAIAARDLCAQLPAGVAAMEALSRVGARLALDEVDEGSGITDLLGSLRPDIVRLRPDCSRTILAEHGSRVWIAQFSSLAQRYGTMLVATDIQASRQALAAWDAGIFYAQGPYLDGGPQHLASISG